MDQPSLYDEDIYAWAEQQATALRSLAARRDLPNELDLENMIEKIETVGRSELHAAGSCIRRILLHIAKAVSDPGSDAFAHWVEEVSNWHGDLIERITPTIRAKVDTELIWRQARAAFAVRGRSLHPALGDEACPLTLDAVAAEDFDFMAAMQRLTEVLAGRSAPPS